MSSAAATKLGITPGWSASADHPYCRLVRSWLRDCGDDPSRFESHDEEDGSVCWHLTTDLGVSLIIRIYEDSTGRIFYFIETAVARFLGIPKGEAFEAMLRINRTVFEAFKVGMLDDGTVTCLSRGRCEGIMPDYFRHLLENILGFSRDVQKDLIENHGFVAFRAAIAEEIPS
jgi:hypothetical protein